MGKELVADPRLRARATDELATSLLIAVPFYRNEQLVPRFVRSLIACADEIAKLDARVVFFNDSPDYPALAAALDAAVAEIGSSFKVAVRTNAQNLGWLKTANLAMREAARCGADALLFNSDTVVFPGSLSEIAAVARLDPMVGFVSPRSNNATLATFPVDDRFARMPPDEAFAIWREFSRSMPRVSYAPTAVGFAILIRRFIIEEFGGFDEIYGGGYNEENDLVMRAARAGYRAVLANHAYVWHQGEQSLGSSESSKALVEEANREILVSRYPEYPMLVQEWFEGVEHVSERLLSALIPRADGRLRIAFDFSSFGNYHSGTQKAGAQLLRSAAAWKDRYEICVLCEPEPFRFHGFDKMGVTRCNPHHPECFAAVFRVGQPFEWDAVRRLSLKGAVVGIFMLDTIAMDCSHLYSPQLSNIWQHVLTWSDFIVYNSEFTQRQYQARFPVIEARRQAVSLHSLDIADYAPLADGDEGASNDVLALDEGYVLILGNHYPHKAVAETANRIAAARRDLEVVALGVTKERTTLQGAPPASRAGQDDLPDDRLAGLPNLTGFRVGGLSDTDMEVLQRRARVLVMPSHYEGFGLPVPIALAMKKPIVVRAIPSLTEIHRKLGSDPNVHFFETTDDLMRLLEHPPVWIDSPAAGVKGDAERAARDIRELIEAAMAEASYSSISGRFRAIHAFLGAYHQLAPPPTTPPNQIARRVGAETEQMVARLLRNRTVYRGMRVLFRAARFAMGKGGRKSADPEADGAPPSET